MKLLEAIIEADGLRPNDIPDSVKAGWLTSLEGEFAEMMEVEIPKNTFPEDRELLMPPPHDGLYPLYLAAMIDSANEETSLYANDMELANEAIGRAKACFRRHNRPKPAAGFVTR